MSLMQILAMARRASAPQVAQQVSPQVARSIMKQGEWVRLVTGDIQWRWKGMTYATVTDVRKAFKSRSAMRYEVDETGETFERLPKATVAAIRAQAIPRLIADGYLDPRTYTLAEER